MLFLLRRGEIECSASDALLAAISERRNVVFPDSGIGSKSTNLRFPRWFLFPAALCDFLGDFGHEKRRRLQVRVRKGTDYIPESEVLKRFRSEPWLKFFIEDMATCPNFADQSGWGFISGLTNYDDNRISVTCVQRKIHTMSSRDHAPRKNSAGSSCCRQLNLIIPSQHSETGLAQFASVYTFNADLSDDENTFYINSKGNTLQKIGNSLWGVSIKHSDTNFKMYVGKQPKCPEDIKQHYGLWHYFSSITSMWTADNSVSLTCATEQRIEIDQPAQTTTTSIPTTTKQVGCCSEFTILNMPGEVVDLVFTLDGAMPGKYYKSSKFTFHYSTQHKMWIVASEYNISQSKCYEGQSKNGEVCPEEIDGVFSCLVNSRWTPFSDMRIKCNKRQQATATTTQMTSIYPSTTKTKLTTRMTTTRATTTKRKTTTTISSRTSKGCCKNLKISSHGISSAAEPLRPRFGKE
jgi:hypothetical protein